MISFLFSFQPSDNIVPVTSGEKALRPRSQHLVNIRSTGGSVASDQDISENQKSFLSTPKSLVSNDDSLTFSEDSDTTRIYNLNTRETKIVVPVDDTKPESPIESPVKLTHQFFRNSPKRVAEVRKMDDDVTTVIRTSNRNLSNGDVGSVSLVLQINVT